MAPCSGWSWLRRRRGRHGCSDHCIAGPAPQMNSRREQPVVHVGPSYPWCGLPQRPATTTPSAEGQLGSGSLLTGDLGDAYLRQFYARGCQRYFLVFANRFVDWRKAASRRSRYGCAVPNARVMRPLRCCPVWRKQPPGTPPPPFFAVSLAKRLELLYIAAPSVEVGVLVYRAVRRRIWRRPELSTFKTALNKLAQPD